MRKLVHISDLHFGRIDDRLVTGLERKIHEISPDVIVVSGDLTQRARVGQFREAKAFLERLAKYPQIVVPGNHDMPLFNPVVRYFAPFAKYQRLIQTELEPVYEDEQIIVAGICTADPYQVERGRVRHKSVDKLKKFFQKQTTKMRLLVSHHPLDLFQTGVSSLVSANALLELKPDILLAGHQHNSIFQSTAGVAATVPHRSLLLVQSGTATSTRVRGEANSFNVLELEANRARLVKLGWDETKTDFLPGQYFEFRLKESGWVAEVASV